MPETPFFRLLRVPVDQKGEALAAQIAALNNAALNNTSSPSDSPPPQAGEGPGVGVFTLDPAAFRNRLDRVALLNLPPDLNDGVLIGIAPLWELTPWKEAQKMWEALVAGEYPWSAMARRMRERGLVRRQG